MVALPGATSRFSRWYRPLCAGLAAGFLIVWIYGLRAAATMEPPGEDLRLWVVFGHRWLDTGSLFTPAQLSGPTSGAVTADLVHAPSLYPAAAGPLFAVAAMLPAPLALLWWLVPLGLTGWVVWHLRPAPWTWPIMAACLAWPEWSIWAGGTSMWVMAATAAGLVWRWPSALILLKPTFAPLAFIGVRDRRWWIAAAVITLITFAGPWSDYLVAARNITDVDWRHNLAEIPMILIPIVAGIGSERLRAGGRPQDPEAA